MVDFVFASGVHLDRYYKMVEFYHLLRASDIATGKMSYRNIVREEKLGKLIQIRQYGHAYDPDVLFLFETEDGDLFEHDPPIQSTFGYVEYDPEEESASMSRDRVIERTLLLKVEIEGNDWALRPENVVATQGIDLSRFAECNRIR
jgi:hypothetical protein